MYYAVIMAGGAGTRLIELMFIFRQGLGEISSLKREKCTRIRTDSYIF